MVGMNVRACAVLLASIAQMMMCTAAFAQLLDDVDFRREANDAVVRIHFGHPIQYQRSIASKSGDLVQIFYNVLPTGDRPSEVVGERRVVGGNGLPKMVVTDEAISAGDPFKRKVLVQLEVPTPFTVRAGRRQENLEVVLQGLGPQVREQDKARPLQTDGKAYLLILQTSLEPGERLRNPLPVPLQNKEVFSTRRVVDGKTAYDINLGYFAEQADADKALRLLGNRFPQAQVVSLRKGSGLDGMTDVDKNYFVVLQSSADPSDPLKASIPAALQLKDVFTSSRVSEGRTIYDFNLGYFKTNIEAEAAREALSRRFPDAAVVPVQKPTLKVEVPPAPSNSELPAQVVAQAPSSVSEIEASAAGLMGVANAANERGDFAAAISALDSLLNLPPNVLSRKAQEQIGITRLKAGDRLRAKGEFETFLKLYPKGTDSDQIRQYLQNLPQEVPQASDRRSTEPVSSISGSISTFYYGGESKTRSQDFADSPLGGVPVLVSENELTGQDQSQMQTNVDLNWRYRDAEKDQRFVLRESYSSSFLAGRPDRERLSALYYEQRNSSGLSFKVGRQSPSGGGILYRFDGIQMGYRFAPKWKVSAVYGVPTDALLDARRNFYGFSLDADSLTPHLGASVFVNQQLIDDEVDRSAVGTEVRYFNNGLIVSGQLDYDQLLRGLNVASLQGSLQFDDNSVANVLLDRRAVPVRSLGNVLFFQDPTLAVPARSIRELLQTTPIDMLRDRVNGVTPFQTQATVGYNRPISSNWQIGGSVNYTNVDEIQPVADILPNGQPSTGDLWGAGLQLVGSNLYSSRDTHVFSLNYMSGPTYNGVMLAYNNMTGFESWQFEPSIRLYTQSSSDGTRSDRLTPGVRFSYRAIKRVSIDSEVTYEIADTVGPSRKESSTRMFYYVGGRFDF